MKGIRPHRSNFSYRKNAKADPISVSQVRVQQLIKIDEIQKALEGVHKEVSGLVTANRQKQIDHYNKETNVISPNFDIGDFLVVCRAQDKGHKLRFRWVGLRCIKRVISDTVYEVTDLMQEKVEIVHAARLLLYRAKLDGSFVSRKLCKQAGHIEAKLEIVDKLLDIGEADDGIFVQVQWLGQRDRVDWTWQPLLEIHQDLPERLLEFPTKTRKKRISKKAQAALGIQI